MKKKKPSKRIKPGKSNPPAPTVSRRKLWLFRLTSLIFIPLLLVGGLEMGLRLAHYGYPPQFFLKTRISGQDFYVPNDRFGYRFFPPQIARTPFALRMPVKKPAKCYRIFLFGESAAQGDPDPTFGCGRYLEALLRERYPGTDFEVICTAMTAINSHVILPIARECAQRDGDLWIIYMGNNEMVGPFGASTVFGPKAPGVAIVRAGLALKATATGQLLSALVGRWSRPAGRQKTWGGLGMFEQNQLRHDDPIRQRAYRNFARNLEDILAAARSAGVPVLLSTVASNLKDCAPFASLHRLNLAEAQSAEWQHQFSLGLDAQKAGQPAAALLAFSNALAIDPDFAELTYRMGMCELAQTNLRAARRDFTEARDCDALGFRADSEINGIIRSAAHRHAPDGVTLVPADDLLCQASPQGITGEELFYEHVHLDFAGNYLLARAFADQVAKQLPANLTRHARSEWASESVCDDRLAVSEWDRFRVWQANYGRVSEAPFTSQLNDAARARWYAAKLAKLQTEMTSAAQNEAVKRYRAAIAASPDDPSLHSNFAQFLSQTGDFGEAVREEETVCELLPGSAPAWHRKGLLLVRENKLGEAIKCFEGVLALRDDYVPAISELGIALANRQQPDAARKYFARAVQLNPGNVEAQLGWGFMEQNLGRMDAALKHYQIAAELQPDGPATHFYNAVRLALDHHREEAMQRFKAAVWMNPEFWQAHYLLGVELAMNGDVVAAEAQFAEAVQERPDFLKARLNLGVAEAKLRKLDAALKQFQLVLKVDPANEVALKNLRLIEAMPAKLEPVINPINTRLKLKQPPQ